MRLPPESCLTVSASRRSFLFGLWPLARDRDCVVGVARASNRKGCWLWMATRPEVRPRLRGSAVRRTVVRVRVRARVNVEVDILLLI